MAKNKSDDTEESTALVDRSMTTVGAFMPAAFEELIGDGFASIDTVMIGDPDVGKLPFYVGRLIGPGEPIQINDSENAMPTWAFHPVGRDKNGKLGVVESVTHIIPAAYSVNAACARIMAQCERDDRTALVGIQYLGKGNTRTGRALNLVRVFEKYEKKVS